MRFILRKNNFKNKVQIRGCIVFAGQWHDIWLVALFSGERAPAPYLKCNKYAVIHFLSRRGIAPELPIFRFDNQEDKVSFFSQPFNGMGWITVPLSEPIWFSRN
jgi:hypothetical protein